MKPTQGHRRIVRRGILLGVVAASLGLGTVGLAILLPAILPSAIALAAPAPERSPIDAPPSNTVAKPDGKELFAREWLPNDPRSARGDGLGPVFNDSSCVACHNLGGAGGGGPASKNVHILTTASATRQNESLPTATQSFVLHHFGTDAEFAVWRAKMAQAAAMGMELLSGLSRSQLGVPSVTPPSAGGVGGGTPPSAAPGETPTEIFLGGIRVAPGSGGSGGFGFFMGNSISQRNATALFGAGKIDSIPERVLEAAAAAKYSQFPKVTGRVARDDKGRAGRFGWKAQKASLDDFVLTACAVELGLHVPGRDQPPLPHKPDYKAPGLDLTQDECDALVKYIADLPAPVAQRAEPAKHAEFIAAGKALFTTVGCAACHTPKLGDVEGIYSDLLLHDLGPALTDAGSSYGIFQPNPQPSRPETKPQDIVQASGQKARGQAASGQKPAAVIATPQEWRTPPLWGVRDSGPYLHDGRATTLEQAIAFHGGQAEDSTVKFTALSLAEKQKLLAFLKSLVAPEQFAAR